MYKAASDGVAGNQYRITTIILINNSYGLTDSCEAPRGGDICFCVKSNLHFSAVCVTMMASCMSILTRIDTV